jgi:leucyl aminopeptidase
MISSSDTTNEKLDSYRPDDIVTTVTGETVEVVHSDAEGRMILADTLAIASRKVSKQSFHSFRDTSSPKLLLDFATLTGLSVLSIRYAEL